MTTIKKRNLENEKSYSAKDIEVLEGLEPVRHRPAMYIGGSDERAMHHLAAELLDNAMDEAVATTDANASVVYVPPAFAASAPVPARAATI